MKGRRSSSSRSAARDTSQSSRGRSKQNAKSSKRSTGSLAAKPKARPGLAKRSPQTKRAAARRTSASSRRRNGTLGSLASREAPTGKIRTTSGKSTSSGTTHTQQKTATAPHSRERRQPNRLRVETVNQPSTEPADGVVRVVDPLEVEAREHLQREAARAPLIPRGPLAPRPMPPQSGKPIWRRPHSG